MNQPIVRLNAVGKSYGALQALSDVDLSVYPGEVTCVLGDNGAGKSTLIKIISGLHQHDSGTVEVDGGEVRFSTPRDALDAGIATVYQDLAVVDLMEVWRNFFLGSELRKPIPVLRPLDVEAMRRITDEQLRKFGIELPNVNRKVGTLSGGQRQCVAIARAKVLILDEPTAALGVKQSSIVLRYVDMAREAGVGVVFITHNPQHAYLIGDHFIVLKLGRMKLDARRDDISLEALISEMAGGAELAELGRELRHGRNS
jgi:simple sugar transport system ATP-binding protein